MRLLLKCAFAAAVALTAVPARAQNRILATVNDEAVSQLDVRQRKALTRLLSKNQTLFKGKDADRQILNLLIDEKLKMQEARKLSVSLSSKETSRLVEDAVRQNGYSLEELKAKLKRNNIPFSTVEDMIKADFLFLRAVRKQAGQRADIADSEIDAKIAEMEKMLKTKQYFLSEIVVPFKNASEDGAAYGRAMQALMALRDGEPLEKVVAAYSKAPSAQKGGVLGWIPETQLTRPVRDELDLMSAGEVSTPVKTGNAYKIFILHNVQNPSDMKEQDAYKLAQIFIPSDAKDRSGTLKKLANTNGSCEKFVTFAIQKNQTPRIDLGTLTAAELPAPVLERVRKAGLLKVTEALPIESGELRFMACEKTKASPLPSRDEVRMTLENARINVLAQRRLRDLRRTAVMDLR